MKRTALVVAALLLAASAFSMHDPAMDRALAAVEANLTPRVVVELTSESAGAVRSGSVPSASFESILPNAVLEPLFHVPPNPEHELIWRNLGLDRWFTVAEPAITNPSALVAELSPLPDVLSADLSHFQVTLLEPADYGQYSMWGLDAMHAPAAWDQQIGDDSVIITTIDTGCEIYHPDLRANVRINPGEDLNGNGIFDPTDVNGIDDDNNGYVDDLAGWDFVSANPPGLFRHPQEDYAPRDNRVFPDIVGHGTHVSGTTASVTNNAVGLPSASWNVTNMPLRAGYALRILFIVLGVGDEIDFAAAIQYAADNGSDIISISFGGTSYSDFYQDAVDYARALGVAVFAAAGNSSTDAPSYPAALDGVLAVAATQPGDIKASFSNYGTWVDLAAPGVNIWSTVPGGYQAYDGTSMASPNAAAVAALILSHNPEITLEDLETYVLEGCDNIDDINPNYAGLLGAGRANAEASLALAAQDYDPSPVANLDVVPLTSPLIIPPGGGSFGYRVTVSNSSGVQQVFDAWMTVMFPDGMLFGPSLVAEQVSADAGETMMYTLTQAVPGFIPPGNYRYTLSLGEFGGDEDESDAIAFAKSAGAGAADVQGNAAKWPHAGWPAAAPASAESSDEASLPSGFTVGRFHPNPFNEATSVAMTLPESAELQVRVYDRLGRDVARLAGGAFPRGRHRFVWNAAELSSGLYFVRSEINGRAIDIQKLVLTK